MDSPVSIWAYSAQSRENLALSHSCTWQTCFSFHPHQGNATGKQWCNRDSFRSQRAFRDPQKFLERLYINHANSTPKNRLDCMILVVRAIPAWVQGALCSSSCEDHSCPSLLHRSGCSQVHSNKPRTSYLQDSSID